ncbi:MAG: ThuA domain-containing protein, partial [Verrucomicrobiaceae bacterium]
MHPPFGVLAMSSLRALFLKLFRHPMIHRHLLTALVSILGAQAVFAQAPMDTPRRLEVLFLGDDAGHKPIERYRVIKQVLAPQGINVTFVEDLSKITRENLDLYDALLVYANHEQDKAPADIFQWVKDGGGLVALHSACGNFHPSKEWFDLVGGKFKSHEGHEMTPKVVDHNHPITKNLPALTAWDETYVHSDLTGDRHLLQAAAAIDHGGARDA